MKRRPPAPMSPRSRSVFQGITGIVTGAATFGALVGTGWYTGVAAADYERDQAEKAEARARAEQARAEWFAAHPVTRVVEKKRKHRTVVRTIRVAPAAAAPGPGGSVTQYSGSGGSGGTGGSSGTGGSGGSGGSGGGGSATPAAPPPPPPPPPPAPSSGS